MIMRNNSMTGPEVKLYRAKDEYVRYFSESCSCGKPEQTGNSGGELIKASEVLKSGSEDIFIAEILGDSMIEADIKRGDLVVINTQVPAKDGDVVLAMLDDYCHLAYCLLCELHHVLDVLVLLLGEVGVGILALAADGACYVVAAVAYTLEFVAYAHHVLDLDL